MRQGRLDLVLYILLTRLIVPAVVVGLIAMGVQWCFTPGGYVATAKIRWTIDPALRQIGGVAQQNMDYLRYALDSDLRGRQAIKDALEDAELIQHLPRKESGELTPEGNRQWEAVTDDYQARVSLSHEIKSDIIEQIAVRFRGDDPELAARFVNQLAENYIRFARQNLDAMLLDNKQTIEKNVERFRNRISDLESKKWKFEQSIGSVISSEPDNVSQTMTLLAGRSPEQRSNLIKQVLFEQNLMERHAEYDRIERDLIAAKDDVILWSKLHREISIALALEVSMRGTRLSMIERASESLPPYRPDTRPMWKLASIIGGTFGVLVYLTQAIVNISRGVAG